MVELTTRAHVVGVVAKLLVLLAGRDRLVLLPELVAAFRERMLEHQHIVAAEITTTGEVGAEQMQAIEHALSKATGRTVTLSLKRDPAIIGGLVARVGSTVYDASIARQLQRMKETLERA